MRTQHNTAFTLIELLITIGIASILLALAAPSFVRTLEKRRIIGAAEEISAQIQLARSEAVKRSADTYVSFKKTSSTNWCMGLDDSASCDCTTPDDCQLGGTEKVITSSQFADAAARRPRLDHVAFGAGTSTRLKYVRGTATAGHVYLESPEGLELNVIVSTLGLVRLCSPSGATHVNGYSSSNCP